VGLEFGVEALDLGIADGYRVQDAGVAEVLLLAVLLVQIIAGQVRDHALLQLAYVRIGMVGHQVIAELGNLEENRGVTIWAGKRN